MPSELCGCVGGTPNVSRDVERPMLYLMYARPWVRIRLHSHCRQQQLTATIRTRHLSLSQFRETQNFSDERLLGDDTDELVEADAEPELAQAGEERRKDRKKEGKGKSKKRKKKRRREGGEGRREAGAVSAALFGESGAVGGPTALGALFG